MSSGSKEYPYDANYWGELDLTLGPKGEEIALVVGPGHELEAKVHEVKVLRRAGSPWLEIEVPDGALAIWTRTGAVHPVHETGAVTDKPLQLPACPPWARHPAYTQNGLPQNGQFNAPRGAINSWERFLDHTGIPPEDAELYMRLARHKARIENAGSINEAVEILDRENLQ